MPGTIISTFGLVVIKTDKIFDPTELMDIYVLC